MPADLRNPALASITGLGNLQSLRSLILLDAPVLTVAPDFSELAIAEEFWIQQTGLTQAPTLPALGSLAFDLQIRDNPSLTTIDGIDALVDARRVVVRDNDQLAMLEGLTGLTSVASGLEIVGNPVLCSSAAQRVADQLTLGTVSVIGNLDGC